MTSPKTKATKHLQGHLGMRHPGRPWPLHPRTLSTPHRPATKPPHLWEAVLSEPCCPPPDSRGGSVWDTAAAAATRQ